jgi:hypothetical protein
MRDSRILPNKEPGLGKYAGNGQKIEAPQDNR